MVQRKQNRRHRRSARAVRQSAGMYIVEALVAMVIGGIISFALLDMYCASLRTMNRASSDAKVSALVDELTEYTRSLGYTRLREYSGQVITLPVNKTTDTAFENPAFHNRPILMDFVRRKWADKVKNSRLDGTLTYYVFDGPDADSLNVAIDFLWTDSTGVQRSLGRVIVLLDTAEVSS